MVGHFSLQYDIFPFIENGFFDYGFKHLMLFVILFIHVSSLQAWDPISVMQEASLNALWIQVKVHNQEEGCQS